MDCRKAEMLIQLELDRALLGDDDSFSMTEGASGMTSLGEHVSGCPRCESLMQELSVIDAALRSSPVEKAPMWLASSIMSEIAETSTSRRLAAPLGLSAAVAAGVTGAVLVLVRSGTGQAARRGLSALANALSSLLGSAQDAITGPAGLQTAQASQMGEVIFGVLLAAVTVSIAFVVVSGLRTARELTHELQPISLH